MKPDAIKALYDEEYAASYERKFLQSVATSADAQHELSLLRSWLTPSARWLDVACGTGYFLRQFPSQARVGLDLSPAMLERARIDNPGADFVQHDFRLPMPEWNDRFDLVSCMWYAYGYVDSMAELSQLVRNLASWTAPGGRCFVPLADPRLISRQNVPYHIDAPMFDARIKISAILWTYVDDDGAKIHSHLLAPQIEYLQEEFEGYFKRVDIIEYPETSPGVGKRPALVATQKR